MRRRKAMWEKADIPARHQEERRSGPERWQQTTALVKGKVGTGMLIALLGARGVGKTQVAVEAARSSIQDQGRSALYTRAMDVFLGLRATFRNDSISEQEAISEFLWPCLLIIDEAHQRGNTPWEDRVLEHLVDVRYGKVLDTILISNEAPAVFMESIGRSITSRLVEAGGIVLCDWPSFRRAPSGG